jgi:hypothetical protein
VKLIVTLEKEQWDVLFNAFQEMPFKYIAPLMPILSDIQSQGVAQIAATKPASDGNDNGKVSAPQE